MDNVIIKDKHEYIAELGAKLRQEVIGALKNNEEFEKGLKERVAQAIFDRRRHASFELYEVQDADLHSFVSAVQQFGGNAMLMTGAWAYIKMLVDSQEWCGLKFPPKPNADEAYAHNEYGVITNAIQVMLSLNTDKNIIEALMHYFSQKEVAGDRNALLKFCFIANTFLLAAVDIPVDKRDQFRTCLKDVVIALKLVKMPDLESVNST